MAADGTFPRSGAGQPAIGPNSNTGQKGGVTGRVLIDFLTVTFNRSRLASLGVTRHADMLRWLAPASALHLCSPTGRPRNFFPDHANILHEDDNGGILAGFVAWSDEAVCVSLSGVGCAGVRNWLALADCIEQAGAKITRCDIAFDDFAGVIATPAMIRDLWQAGEFNGNGRPPKAHYIDDLGTGKGCTASIGQKGYRELCAYEKGKQLADPTSPWVRIEGRFYAKHQVLSADMLRRPLEFLRGMYPVLGRLLHGIGERVETIKRTAIATATAMVRWMRRQCGGALHALRAAFPCNDEFAQVLGEQLARSVRPRRLKHPATADTINEALRNACHAYC